MNICKNLSVERLYEEGPYKYRAISSALRFGTQ